jgi:predicted XRE-type DNA-binding protein
MKTHTLTLAKAKAAPKAAIQKATPKPVVAKEAQRFASVFDALADTPQEAANMRARAQLARQINDAIKEKGWTQAAAAEHCGVTQPRISDLINGRISRFSLDALVNIASAIGQVNVELELEHV